MKEKGLALNASLQRSQFPQHALADPTLLSKISTRNIRQWDGSISVQDWGLRWGDPQTRPFGFQPFWDVLSGSPLQPISQSGNVRARRSRKLVSPWPSSLFSPWNPLAPSLFEQRSSMQNFPSLG